MEKKPRKQKGQWFVASTITKNTLFMMSLPCRFFFQKWPRLGLGNKLTRYFSYFKDDLSEMWYIRREFDEAADFLAKKMIKNPDWAIKIINKVENWSKKFIVEAKKFRELSFKEMGDAEMIELWERVLKWHELSHGIGASVSWHADTDKERVTKAITKTLEEQIKKRKLKISIPEAFSALSTPQEESFAAIEEKEFLKTAIKLNKLNSVFKSNGLKTLARVLEKEYPSVFLMLKRHFLKWSWLPYGYKGPAYDFEYFLERWQALFKAKQNSERIYRKIVTEKRRTESTQKKILKMLKFNPYQLKLIKLSQRIVFIKEFRKGVLYHGIYCYEPFFKEITKRLNLSIEHIWAMNAWEIGEALLERKFNRRELERRMKEAVAYVDKKKYVVWTGKKARDFFRNISKEKVVEEEIEEFKGTCASPGYARGQVKIVEVTEDMGKMNNGDILVSETTYPALVPAMRKASAIVTNAGGLTCHAAIVSRELKIPCVVGTKIATKALKDGDLVEVDANKGVVRIFKK